MELRDRFLGLEKDGFLFYSSWLFHKPYFYSIYSIKYSLNISQRELLKEKKTVFWKPKSELTKQVIKKRKQKNSKLIIFIQLKQGTSN